MTADPRGAPTRSSRSRSRTPVQSPLGAPALDAGDRQLGRRLRHGEEVGTGERQRTGRRARGRGGTPGRSRVAVTPAAASALVDREVLRAVAGADAEHGDLAQPRHGAAGRQQDRDGRGDAGGAHAGRGARGRRREARRSSTGPERACADDGSLTAMCTTQRADRHPGHGVVGGPERERPGVPLVVDVGQPGGELEDRGGDEHRDRGALERRAASSSRDGLGGRIQKRG